MLFKDVKGISYYLPVRCAWDGDPMTWNVMWKGIKSSANTLIRLWDFLKTILAATGRHISCPSWLSVIKTKLEEGDENVSLFSVDDDNAVPSCARIKEKYRKFSTYW